MNYFERQIAMNMLYSHRHHVQMPNTANAQEWLNRIENELSPENLSCDGELRGRALQQKRVELLAAYDHCVALLPNRNTIPRTDPDYDPRYGRSFDVAYAIARRERTQARQQKLQQAVQSGFKTGARVVLSNGVTGMIQKVNRTRVKVKGDDGRLWSVPPRCMQLAGPRMGK